MQKENKWLDRKRANKVGTCSMPRLLLRASSAFSSHCFTYEQMCCEFSAVKQSYSEMAISKNMCECFRIFFRIGNSMPEKLVRNYQHSLYTCFT